tara:strand:- start:176 stop:874 length:699 start_codon:yes stop_codon:yes gene_type:complete
MASETVLITGSGRGLGRELALVFAEHNYNLILNSRGEINHEFREEMLSMGSDVHHVVGDIREIGVMDRLVDLAKREDISVLINNAGAPTEGCTLDELSYDEVMETITTNLISPIYLTKGIYPLLKEKGRGTIINLNSMIGLECKEFKGIGSAARWGLRGFTGSIRPEMEKDGINVVGVYPTKIKTKPEYEFGFEPREVAERIYRACADGFSGMIKMDGRPEEFKPKKDIEYG